MGEIKSEHQMRLAFQKRLYRDIIPCIKYFEKTRITWLITAILVSLALAVLGLLIALPAFHGAEVTEGQAQLVVLSFIGAFATYGLIKKNFELKIKTRIMPAVCRAVGNINWTNGAYSDGNIFEDSNLVSSYNRQYYDDIFYGKFGDTNIEIIEVHLTLVTGSGKNRSETTKFKGAIIKFDMNKKFDSNTVIRPNSLMHFTPNSNLRHTELEDVVFEKKFDVFTDDEVEARYLITPSFMERLNNIKVAFKADKVSCAFYQNYLLVGLHTNKDLFSVGSLLKPVCDKEQFYQMFDEIASVVKLIKHFKLNQKIGL